MNTPHKPSPAVAMIQIVMIAVTLFTLAYVTTPTATKPAPKSPIAVVVQGGPTLPSGKTVRLLVVVLPNKDNKSMWISIEADGYAKAFNLPAATREVDFEEVPDGEYIAWARVLRDKGTDSDNRLSARAAFTVGGQAEAEE